MSDNVAITAGVGTTIACDEVVDATLGTVKVQFTKIMDGTLDSTNKLIVDSSGRVSALVAPATVPTSAKISAVSGAPAAVSIKGSAGTLKGGCLYCNNATIPIFIKFYNVASGSVTVGTTTPLFTIGVAPGAPLPINFGDGIAFSTAISYAITGAVGDSDTTAVATDDLKGVIAFL